MGKPGRVKKSCSHCIRRKVRCDIVEKKQEGKQKCTNCERRKQQCSENNISSSMLTLEAAEGSNAHPSSRTTALQADSAGVKGLDVPLINAAFHAFYSSNCFLSRILIHWKPMLQPLLQSIPSMNPTDPMCVLLEAIISHGMTLDTINSVSSLPSKTAMVHHLRSLLESILSGELGNLHSLTIGQLNALLASCTILLDVWPDTELFYPLSILSPDQSKGQRVERVNFLRLPVDHVSSSTRLMEHILFERKGISQQKSDSDVGHCSHNILLYWYIFLIDSFSESFPERRPFISMDTVTLLEKYVEQQNSNDYMCQIMTQDEIHARNQTAEFMFSLGGLAKVSRKVSSARKMSVALSTSNGEKEFSEIIEHLRLWENSRQAMLVQAIKDQGEVLGYCMDFLHRYCYLRLHVIARDCKTFESEEEDDKKFSYTMRSASFAAWQQIVSMMEELERIRIKNEERHMLLSQSRLMIYSILDCIHWGLRRISIEKNALRPEEWRELIHGSDRMLLILNCYSGEDVCLGLDVLDFMARLEQMAYECKNNEHR